MLGLMQMLNAMSHSSGGQSHVCHAEQMVHEHDMLDHNRNTWELSWRGRLFLHSVHLDAWPAGSARQADDNCAFILGNRLAHGRRPQGRERLDDGKEVQLQRQALPGCGPVA